MKYFLLLSLKKLKLNSSNFGPISLINSTFWPNAYGTIKISEKIIAESKLNLLIGCNVISELNSLFKQSLIKSLFCNLIFLNSGK